MLAQTPPTFDDSALPAYDPERQFGVSKQFIEQNGPVMWAYTTQTFDGGGKPRDRDKD